MTNKTAEDEAEKVAREWALMHVYDQTEQITYADKSKVKPLVEKAHLAGQSFGYARALEEVEKRASLRSVPMELHYGLGRPQVVEMDVLREIITNLKAKGGV